VGAVVCVHAKGMKQPWCLAASDPEATAAVLVNHYARRWTIEMCQSWRVISLMGVHGKTSAAATALA
jgi:hypothetical protein